MTTQPKPQPQPTTAPHRLAVHTLGCKLNQAETSAVGQRFAARGFEVGELRGGGGGDVVLINSCTVTETAEVECRKLVRRALRHNPAAFVIVTGCYAQLRAEEVASIEGVDLVLGSAEKHQAQRWAESFGYAKQTVPQVRVGNLATVSDFGPAYTGGDEGRTRAFLKVQDGCDYRCSFCTIPAARGPSRSQPVADAVAQARQLVARGFREIVLTGVNVGDFGRKDGTSFLALLEALHGVDGLERLKVSSIEPNLLTDEVVALARRSDRLMPHFHIPLQSGSDTVLRRMRRRYGSAEYRALVERLVEAIPDVAIGVDVIVGFPGETDEEFQETVAFLESLPIAYLHVFTYSERPDTPAAQAGDVVPRAVRQRRTTALRALSERKRMAFIDGQLGAARPVLFESVLPAAADDDPEGRVVTGLTDNYVRVDVHVPAAVADAMPTQTTRVRLARRLGERAVGALVLPVPQAVQPAQAVAS